MSEDIERAIAIIEDHRATHLAYAAWQESTPDWKDHVVAEENVGGADHHRECAEKYDHVLAVLRREADGLDRSLEEDDRG